MFLLDAPVVLELRRAKTGQADAGLAAWAGGVTRHSLFLSALTLMELHNGATLLSKRDAAAGAARQAWIDNQVMPAFDGRILPVDAAVVRRRAQLPHANPRDGLLVATALEHGLTLVTRNVAAFKAGRVKVFNPWGYSPEAAEDDADWNQATRAGPMWLQNLFVRS